MCECASVCLSMWRGVSVIVRVCEGVSGCVTCYMCEPVVASARRPSSTASMASAHGNAKKSHTITLKSHPIRNTHNTTRQHTNTHTSNYTRNHTTTQPCIQPRTKPRARAHTHARICTRCQRRPDIVHARGVTGALDAEADSIPQHRACILGAWWW